jgi:hypothetical protein
MANFNQNAYVQGLNTTTMGCPTTDQYEMSATLTLPTIPMTGGPVASAVVATVRQNGSTIYTTAPGTRGFKFGFQGTALDVITVTLTSSAAPDQDINAVKMTISMYEGGE